jgi:KaiC/GvpD/RAD55 family RecA-like ATPase
MLVAKKHPHPRCTSADLPAATRIAERKIAAAGLADRVSAKALDFFAEPLPKADVITMGMILHDWNLEKKMYLVRAAYDALSAGGAFVVIQNLIDDARRKNARATYVAKYVDRVRRCLRFHGRRFLRLVSGGGLQQNRGDSIGRARK